MVGPAGADHRALLRDALAAGADLVGGCPHLEDDGDIEAATDVLLEIAAEAGVGVDLHTDETLDPAVLGLEYLARRVLAGFSLPVTASHCVSLGQNNAPEQQRIAELVAAAGIGVITLPHTNLWLGGRGQQPVPRGLTAVDALRRAGVAVAAGADNLQDPFNPMGRACPFETASLMVLVAHDLPTMAWESVSTQSRRVLGLPDGAIAVGAPADLVAVPADVTPPGDRRGSDPPPSVPCRRRDPGKLKLPVTAQIADHGFTKGSPRGHRVPHLLRPPR